MARVGEDGQYTGEHSISFRTKIINGSWTSWVNTNTDWHLVPSPSPVINPPQVKTKSSDNPGGDGILDRTETLTGFPLYGQRTGSWEFIVLNGWDDWFRIYTKIANELHGKSVQVVLEDDPQWYYNGRIAINEWRSDPGHSTITIDYELDPYKLSISESDGRNWLWDPFNFEEDVVPYAKCKSISVGGSGASGNTYLYFYGNEVGRRPVTPTFKIESGVITSLRFYNYELYGRNAYILHSDLTAASSYHWMDVIFTGFNKSNTNKLLITGQDCVMSISYRMGNL